MRIASNKIEDIIRFFNQELSNTYESGELETIMNYCFEEFTGLKPKAILLNKQKTVSESDLLKFNFAVKELKLQKPIQYILGQADFYRLKFNVNQHVLIPRPETEELVHLILTENKANSTTLKILDIGTGSGCIAIALKKNMPLASVYAVDIDTNALSVAESNAQLNNVDVHFLPFDVLNPQNFDSLKEMRFDIIVSNPPYIGASEKTNMHKNVLDYEPHLALFVDDKTPLLFYDAISDFALQHLKPAGKLYFEINQAYGDETQKLLTNKGFKNASLIKDLNDNNRIAKGNL